MKKLVILIIGFVLFFIFNNSYANTGEIDKISYTYYYGQGCAHCANVDKYMKAVDGYEKLNISKHEIYFNDEDRVKYLADVERLGISEEESGIPFLVIKNNTEESFLIGDVPIINHFKTYLGEAPENHNKKIILTIMGILAILIPVFIIKSSK